MGTVVANLVVFIVIVYFIVKYVRKLINGVKKTKEYIDDIVVKKKEEPADSRKADSIKTESVLDGKNN